VLGLCLVQLALLVYDPRMMVPYRFDRVAHEELTAAVSVLAGPVFAPDFGGYVTNAQGQQPLRGAVDELMGGFGGGMTAEGEVWQADLYLALQQHPFGMFSSKRTLAVSATKWLSSATSEKGR
jgi:hypothetical protein